MQLILPRDAFNVSLYLRDVGKLYMKLEVLHLEDKLEIEDNNFNIKQDEASGELYIPSIKLFGNVMYRQYNSKDKNILTIYLDVNGSYQEFNVLDDDGNISQKILSLLKNIDEKGNNL